MSDTSDHVLDGITRGREIGTEDEPEVEIVARVGHLLWEEDPAYGEAEVGGKWVLNWVDGHRDEIGLRKHEQAAAFAESQ
jgi:hypothetical protein